MSGDGLCKCGCGDPAPLAKRTNTCYGHVKGQPINYIPGHQNRKSPQRYIVADDGCWVWQGAVVTNVRGTHPYGKVVKRIDSKDVTYLAHRIAYEQAVGPIPKGLVIDHLCRNTLCVNPDHLEAVTQRVNVARGNLNGQLDRSLTTT